jgi:hypothetical protein
VSDDRESDRVLQRVPLPSEELSPQPQSAPHSEFPVPRNWQEAWPVILWGMLALAFAFVIADSLAALISDPLMRAGGGVVALLGLTAMLIYRDWLWGKFRNPSGGLIAGVLCILLFVLATSPFVEQKRWPFSVWFASTPTDAEPQMAALVEWLTLAQRERDQAILERNSAQRGWADEIKTRERIQSQLTSAQQELDQTATELLTANDEIAKLKTALNAPDGRVGDVAAPHSLMAIAILLWQPNALYVSEKDEIIKDVITQNSSRLGVTTFKVRFIFSGNVGPFSVSAENLTGPTGLFFGASHPVNYSVGDSGPSYAEMTIDLGSSLVTYETILVKFYRK